jgi:hypothetical protein
MHLFEHIRNGKGQYKLIAFVKAIKKAGLAMTLDWDMITAIS